MQRAWGKLTRLKPFDDVSNDVVDTRSDQDDDTRKKALQHSLMSAVTDGWRIEYQSDFEAALSKKSKFPIFGYLCAIVFLGLIFAPLILIVFVVMIVNAINRKDMRRKIGVNEKGDTFIFPI